jgi:hypothetical protein
MMSDEKIVEILAQAGLTGAHAENPAALQSAASVLSAQDAVKRIAAHIALVAKQFEFERSVQGLLTPQGTPALSLTRWSLELDAALVTVSERHAALGALAKVITGDSMA